jgi:hypothetical protein
MSAPFASHIDEAHSDHEQYYSYKAISALAVVSLGLGILSVLMFLEWIFGAIALLGILVGIAARRQIRLRQHELTGLPIAGLGVILSAAMLLSGAAWHTYVYHTEVPEGYTRINYDKLQPTPENPTILPPPDALELDGQQVFIKGYMYPSRSSLVKEFQARRARRRRGRGAPDRLSNGSFFPALMVQAAAWLCSSATLTGCGFRDETPTAEVSSDESTDAASASLTSNTSQPVRSITFDHLKFEMPKGEKFKQRMLTDAIRGLLDRDIKVRGFMYPTPKQNGLTSFVLCRDDRFECCFGPGAPPYNAMVVDMLPGQTTSYTARSVTVEGRLTFQKFEDPIDGEVRCIYHLDAFRVK